MKPSVLAPCPCGGSDPAGRPLAFERCCAPLLAGEAAASAQALMRSRYSAFVRGDSAYLLATWHASTRPAELALVEGCKWLGLEVRSHQLQDDAHAAVTFVARWREPGRWFYVDGDVAER